jgi:hypothetical protein
MAFLSCDIIALSHLTALREILVDHLQPITFTNMLTNRAYA